MRVVGVDTETEEFGPARMAPPLVCTCVSESISGDRNPRLEHVNKGPGPVRQIYEEASNDDGEQVVIVGHNIAYDNAVFCAQWEEVIPLIFEAYEKDHITDTMIRQKLLDISAGCYRGWLNANTGKWIPHDYGLGDLAKRHCDIELNKDSYWRTNYDKLRGIPVHEWPEDAVQYAEEDGLATELVYYQQDKAKPHARILDDEFRQARAAFALHLASTWGIRTDREGVEMLKQGALEEIEEVKPLLLDSGLLRRNGTRNLKAALKRMEQIKPDGKRTDGGRLSLDQESCLASHDEVLNALSTFTKAQNVLSKDVKAMERGIELPIHTRFDSLMETGRTSSSGPNLQNLRRKKGVRECYVPRDGWIFAACDVAKAELHTLAQVCKRVLGKSRLGDLLNKGMDPHIDIGRKLLRIEYDEAIARYRAGDPVVKEARQRGKPASFGFPGGMGVDGFLAYAKGTYGISFTREEAVELRRTWLETFPEMEEYFAWIQSLCGQAGVANIVHLFSNRERGLVPYTVACNSFFQGLAADAAKDAMWEVVKRQYAVPDNPLFGTRTVNFIHDELLIEIPEHRAEPAALELQRVMTSTFNRWVPDYPTRAEAALMYRWSKDAEPRYVNGHLVPWREAA